MRLHTNTLTLAQVRDAVKQAGAHPERLEMRGPYGDGITSRKDKRYHANHAWNVPTNFRGRECKCGAQRDYSTLVGA